MPKEPWRKQHELLQKEMSDPRPYDPRSHRRGDQFPDIGQKFVEPERDAGRPWAEDWENWGRRVRRDILMLEAYLLAKEEHAANLAQAKDRRKLKPAEPKLAEYLYRDPGDPPPPPNGFQ